jgi:hypothetical protein
MSNLPKIDPARHLFAVAGELIAGDTVARVKGTGCNAELGSLRSDREEDSNGFSPLRFVNGWQHIRTPVHGLAITNVSVI